MSMGATLFSIMVLSVYSVLGQRNSTAGNQTIPPNSTHDPYLEFQPNFSRSLPIQLLITGIVLTLCTTLLIQLLFTWQYHWPLARVNWTLQFTGVCTLLLNVIAICIVVLSALGEKSKQWPYMFEYVAIDVPRVEAWSVPETAVWCVMEATTSALASITHIQFLTYLYPSRLEARLVFLLLGPLAVLASIMTLLPISYYDDSPQSTMTPMNPPTFNGSTNNLIFYDAGDGSDKQRQILDLFDAARNICNLTLSLLFTLSLLIWGFLVNRRSAWRTDGGTAAFGVGALFLALVSTGLNFLNVFVHPRFAWLSSLLWSVVLWQSFLGWWWWVGSASGIAAREFDMEKQGRKEQKRAKRKRRKATPPADAEDDALALPAGRLERWRSSVGVTLSRRRAAPAAAANEPIELTTITSAVSDRTPPSTASIATSSASWYSSTQFFATARRAWRSLRQAHVRAARVQAIEQRQIQIQMELENGRGLGRFPGGMGERERGVLRGRSEAGGSEAEAEGGPGPATAAAQQKGEEDPVGAMWWWGGPLRNWRLRDSTTY